MRREISQPHTATEVLPDVVHSPAPVTSASVRCQFSPQQRPTRRPAAPHLTPPRLTSSHFTSLLFALHILPSTALPSFFSQSSLPSKSTFLHISSPTFFAPRHDISCPASPRHTLLPAALPKLVKLYTKLQQRAGNFG